MSKCIECKKYDDCRAGSGLVWPCGAFRIKDPKRERDATDTNVGRKTNAERIRAMTDEELADFLDSCEARGYHDYSVATDATGHCIGMLDWLKQPAGGAEE